MSGRLESMMDEEKLIEWPFRGLNKRVGGFYCCLHLLDGYHEDRAMLFSEVCSKGERRLQRLRAVGCWTRQPSGTAHLHPWLWLTALGNMTRKVTPEVLPNRNWSILCNKWI